MGTAPDPTPPKETSAAATGTNISTAIANTAMGNMNENTAFGSKTVTQTGTKTVTDPYTGQSYEVPTYTVDQTLNPQMQGVVDNTLALAQKQSQANLKQGPISAPDLNTTYNTDFSTDRRRVEEALMSRMNPQLAQDRESLRTRLINQGINEGTEGFDRAMNRANQASTDARMQAILAGGQEQSRMVGLEAQRAAFENAAAMQGYQNQQSQQGLPLAMIAAAQTAQPQFMTGAGAAQAPTTDNASIIGNYDQQKMNQWQQNQAMWGTALSAIGSGVGLALSDERAKTDKKKVGKTNDGQDIWTYRYKGDPTIHMGLMAQDVKRKHPDAVKRGRDGLLRVDYGKAV